MSGTSKGPIDWSLTRNNDGHRDYRLVSHVVTTDSDDGPQVAYLASGLPTIGAPWTYGNDNDLWAFCQPQANVKPIITKEPGFHWTVENFFSTRPLRRCNDTEIENPLLEPMEIGGSFAKFTKEAERDRHGALILSSSHERITGIEMDDNRPTVWIEQNVASLGLDVFSPAVDTLNDAPLWGLPARCIKLSNVSWSRKLYGVCIFYYTRRFEFEIRFEGFDLTDVADTGYKKFDTESFEDTPENRADPTKYVMAKDVKGDNPPKRILLDGNGSPLSVSPGTGTGNVVYIDPIELYEETNFLSLGIPTVL